MRHRLLILALTSILAVAGCSDLGDPFKPQPQSRLSATALDFGTVVVSRSSTRTITITNDGTGTLTGDAQLACAEYALQSGGGAFALGAGQSKSIVVAFTPGAVGSYFCTLALGPNAPAVSLSGSAALQAPGARCIVLDDSLAFGSVAVGQTSLRTFEVINAGTAPLLVDVVPSCADYEIVSGGGPGELPTGGSRTVTVAFHPGAGGPAECTVEVGPDCPIVKVVGFGTSVSYAADIRPILVNRCASCHDFANPSDPQMYEHLFFDFGGFGYIKAFDPGNSWIYQKIKSPPGFGGDRMPQGGPYLTDTQIDNFRRWILEGALEN
ncbi:MAG TPA: choice-of-anchor D domain-containing protein [Candidatus Eisenbacteria bacterium]|nr:choice-of-anchor D domain-containing protein [Candidatus Eisenbacteria bacterium]